MMKEKKIVVSQIKGSVGRLTSRRNHVEDRLSELEDKMKTLEHSVKSNNKLIFAIIFWEKHMNGTCRLLYIP